MVSWQDKSLPYSQDVYSGLLRQTGLFLRLQLLSQHFIKSIVGAKDYKRGPK